MLAGTENRKTVSSFRSSSPLHEEGVTRKNCACNELVSQVARKINTCNGTLNLVLYRKFDTRNKNKLQHILFFIYLKYGALVFNRALLVTFVELKEMQISLVQHFETFSFYCNNLILNMFSLKRALFLHTVDKLC